VVRQVLVYRVVHEGIVADRTFAACVLCQLYGTCDSLRNENIGEVLVVVNGGFHLSQRARESLRAPLPVAGSNVRFYLLPNSSRLYVTGQLLGMYVFGYGDFLSTIVTLGLTVNRHFGIRAGYQLTQRFNINNRSNRILDST
jgi:hypothetical protein